MTTKTNTAALPFKSGDRVRFLNQVRADAQDGTIQGTILCAGERGSYVCGLKRTDSEDTGSYFGGLWGLSRDDGIRANSQLGNYVLEGFYAAKKAERDLRLNPPQPPTFERGACVEIDGYPDMVVDKQPSKSAFLANGSVGFVRKDALLVLVMVTDVDDYGAYDHQGFCPLLPSEGCPTTGASVQQIYDGLVAKKGGDPKAVATIVVAGDPTVNGGQNFCNQPASCGCVDMGGLVDCDVYHADRLWDFANKQFGTNGYKANLCTGPQSVPDAVKAALTSSIDLACQNYVPPS